MSIDERIANLPTHEFDVAAQYTATMIERHGFAYTLMSPRDGTRYEISIVTPPTIWQHDRYQYFTTTNDGKPLTFQQRFSGSYFVATQLGPMHRWEGTSVGEWGYVYEKWTHRRGDTDMWTARILHRFLNTLAPLLPANPERS